MEAVVYDILSSLLYVAIGLIVFWLSIVLVEKTTKRSLYKEIVQDENVALGIMFAGFFIAVAIIIAAAIYG